VLSRIVQQKRWLEEEDCGEFVSKREKRERRWLRARGKKGRLNFPRRWIPYGESDAGKKQARLGDSKGVPDVVFTITEKKGRRTTI